MGSAYSENITEANTVNSTSNNNTTQKKFNADDTSLTITDSALYQELHQQTVHIKPKIMEL